MKSNKGITLIALLITIVVLIILAGVAISLSIGENGIFSKAKYASAEYSNEQAKEETEIAKLTNEIDSSVNSSRDNETNSGQPTGIRTDAYIVNQKTTATTYSSVTSMTSGAFTKTTDADNNIAEYLSYSDTDGYTVLKSGWYHVRLYSMIQGKTSAADLHIRFYINGAQFAALQSWVSGTGNENNSDNFSIYLKQGDKIFFGAQAAGTAATSRNVYGILYPMF